MNATPSRLPSGKIGCPRCETALSKDQAPFYLHGEYVGNFESYVCSMCHYSALTEDGYESARIQAKRLYLIEKKPDVPEIPEPHPITHHHKSNSARHELERRILLPGTTGRGEVSAYQESKPVFNNLDMGTDTYPSEPEYHHERNLRVRTDLLTAAISDTRDHPKQITLVLPHNSTASKE